MSSAKKTKASKVEYKLKGVYKTKWKYDDGEFEGDMAQVQFNNEVIGVVISDKGDERYIFDGVINGNSILGSWRKWADEDDPYWYGEYEMKILDKGEEMSGTYTYTENGIRKREGWKARKA